METRSSPLVRLLSLLTAVLVLLLLGWILVNALNLFGDEVPEATTNIESSAIVIEEPQAGATIGPSFAVLGRLTEDTAQNALVAQVLSTENQPIGGGILAVVEENTITGTVTLTDTSVPGPYRLLVVEQDPETSEAINTAEVEVLVGGEPPPALGQAITVDTPTGQAITIATPAPGTLVGSPIVITGSTNQYPSEGILSYRIVDDQGTVLGTGNIPVQGDPGQPASFTTELTFTLPPAGGPITVELYERDQSSGAIAAAASIGLNVDGPQAQQLVIDTPAPGTLVGSPVVLTGRVSRVPQSGNLRYRVTAADGQELGAGNFPVQGTIDQEGTFTAELTFTLPPGGGPITAEILDFDEALGQTVSQAIIALTVANEPAPPPPSPPPQSPPPPQTTPPATGLPLGQQIILFETPAPLTQVGSPVVLTGRTTQYPFEGNLSYRILNAEGNELAAGSISVAGEAGQAGSFTAELTFTPPAPDTNITVEILERDAATGAIRAASSLVLTYR